MSFDFTFELSIVHAVILVAGWIIGNLSKLKQCVLAFVIAVFVYFFVFAGGDADCDSLIISSLMR